MEYNIHNSVFYWCIITFEKRAVGSVLPQEGEMKASSLVGICGDVPTFPDAATSSLKL